MAVKGRKCQDIRNTDWVSSSFSDSFGDLQDDVIYPAEKRVKLEGNCDSVRDMLPLENIIQVQNVKFGNNRVWTDKYAPKKVDDLIVHKKKVSEVCDYLKSVFNSNRRNRILIITGPTGCGKTCTLNVLCRSMNINVLEWVTPIDSLNGYDIDFNIDIQSDKYIGRNRKATLRSFNEFVLQAAKYSSLLNDCDVNYRKIVLIKDFPDLFLEYPEMFHETVKMYNGIEFDVTSSCNISPIVFILSDTNIVRELFPEDLKHELNVTTISFNPVTQTNMVKALDRILSAEMKVTTTKSKRPNNEELTEIAESCDGDLRSAILKLQFSVANRNGTINFKRPLPKTGSERIRVIKSSSKLKNAKHKICEIDKDKTVDFFNSVGRVLYPKREYLDSNQSEYRFVHSPSVIADNYSTEPNKFINVLHENYLDKFMDIKEVCKAAYSLSLSDILLSSNWESRDVMVKYSLNTAACSLMVSNTKPAPNTFKPISKSRIWITENKKRMNLDLVRQIFPDIQCEKDVLLDVIPYLNQLKVNVNLTKEQDDIISKIAKYR